MRQIFTILLKNILVILLFVILPYSSVLAQADAGTDQEVCSDSTFLAADSLQIGVWTLVSGYAIIADTTLWNTQVQYLDTTVNVFSWTELATGTTDSVSITNNSVYAYSGECVNFCSSEGFLCANDPFFINATGFWTVVTVTVTIDNPTAFDTYVRNLAPGENQLEWTVSHGICSDSHIAYIFNDKPIVDAGPDTEVCNVSYFLQGNIPSFTGLWTILSGSGILTNASLYNSEITITGATDVEMEWAVSTTGCTSRDTVLLTNNIVTAFAGSDVTVCDSSASISGNTPPPGAFGDWLPINTSVFFDDNTSNITMVRSLEFGINNIEWVVTKGSCVARDTVSVTSDFHITSAGVDVEVCTNSYILQGNLPTGGIGMWTILSGSGILTDSVLYNSVITISGATDVEIEWSIENQGCFSRDTVLLTNNMVTANAGSDVTVCDSSASISGNTPPPGAFGDWLPINTSVFFDDPSSNNTIVRSLDLGINDLEWTVTKGSCWDSDTISVTNYLIVAKAGVDTEVCSNSYFLQGNQPVSGSGTWAIQSGGGVIVDPSLWNSEINALGVGTTELEWSIDNSGCNSKDSIIITNNTVTANAGADEVACDTTYGPLNANDPALQQAYGDWTPVNTSVYFEDYSLYNTKVISLDPGANSLSWTVFKGTCFASDTVIITYLNNYFADAGADLSFYSNDYPNLIDTARLNAVVPSEGTAQWSVVQGPATIINLLEPKAFVSGLEQGENVFRWTISSGICTSFDDISIISGFSFMPGDTVTQLNWADPADWDNGIVPGVGDSVTIINTNAVLDGDTVFCEALYVSSGSDFNIRGGGVLNVNNMGLSVNNLKFAGVDGGANMIVAGDGTLKIGYGSALKATGGSGSRGLRIGTGGSVIIEQDAEKATGAGGQLLVRGGSIIIEQDAEKATGDGGTMHIRGSVIIEQDAEKSARFKSATSNNLVIRRGGSVIIEQDAEKSTSAGGLLLVRGGGSIIIEQDAEKSTYAGGTMRVRSGSVIIEQDAEKATFSGNGKLFVKGGSVIIEQDAEKTTYKTEIIVPLTEIHGGQIIIGKLSNAKVTGSGFRTGSIIIEQDAEKSTDVDTSLIVKTGGSLLFDASLNQDNDFSLRLGSNTFVTFENGSIIDLDYALTGNPKPIIIKENASLIDMNENNQLAGKFEHLFIQNNNELFSTPFTSQNSTVFTAEANINIWDEANFYFEALTGSKVFNYMEGFDIIYPNVNYLSITEGTLNTGALSLDLNYTEGLNADQNGWNLCGNPYPSSVNWEQAVINSFSATVYQYDNTGKQYKLYQQGGLSLNGGIQYIKPGQGFFVRASSVNVSLVLNNNMRIHYFDSGTPATESPNNFLKLKVEGNTYSDETIVRFVNEATDNYDEVYDAYKLLSPDTDVPQLYTLVGNENSKMAINSMKPAGETAVTVPLNFKAGVDGDYTITATDLNFDVTVPVILKDLKDNSTHDLVSTPTYSFTYSTADADGRFEIQFGAGITGIDDIKNALKIDIYAFGTDVFIKTFDDKNYQYEIYNMNGKLVKNDNLFNKGLNTISMNSISGVYIVKVISGNSISRKSISIIK